MRTIAGFPSFEAFEGDFSDFTVEDATISSRIAHWVFHTGHTAARSWLEGNMTFHLEVKTTTGSYEETFMMSNRQFENVGPQTYCFRLSANIWQARRWHKSQSDVYLIVRVSNILARPQVDVYIDPFALALDGKLRFSAQGGYNVELVQ